MQLSKVTTDLVQVLPGTFTNTKTYPLIIHAHGVGAQWGIDSLATGELPFEIQKSTDQFGFIVLAPWTSGDWQLSHYDKTIAYAKANLPIDWKRVYLMGLSLGGQLVTKVISTSRANDIAATAVACGVNNLSTGSFVKAAGLGCVFFHAVNDGKVDIANSRNAVKMINDTLPPVKAKLVEYSAGDHWIWSKAFSLTEKPWTGNESPATVYDWLLMNTIDKSVEVPVTEIPTWLTAKATATISGNQILLSGEQSTGTNNWSWTDISDIKSVWVGGTGWKTAVSQPTKSGIYKFQLKVTKDGVSATDTVTVDFQIGAQPIPEPIFKPTHILHFKDGTKQEVRIETL